MADLPFGFSSGDDPDRDKHGKDDPDSGSGANPLGQFGMGGDFGMATWGRSSPAWPRCPPHARRVAGNHQIEVHHRCRGIGEVTQGFRDIDNVQLLMQGRQLFAPLPRCKLCNCTPGILAIGAKLSSGNERA